MWPGVPGGVGVLAACSGPKTKTTCHIGLRQKIVITTDYKSRYIMAVLNIQSSEGSPIPHLGEIISVPAQAHLYILMQEQQMCLALRTRGIRIYWISSFN